VSLSSKFSYITIFLFECLLKNVKISKGIIFMQFIRKLSLKLMMPELAREQQFLVTKFGHYFIDFVGT